MKTLFDLIGMFTYWPYWYLWQDFRGKNYGSGHTSGLCSGMVTLGAAFVVFVHFLLVVISILVYFLIK